MIRGRRLDGHGLPVVAALLSRFTIHHLANMEVRSRNSEMNAT